MREVMLRMGFGGLLGFATMMILPILVRMIGDGDPGLERPFEMMLVLTGKLKWVMLAISALSFSGLAISFMSDALILRVFSIFLQKSGFDKTAENREDYSLVSEKAELESKLKIITKQIEKVNSFLGRSDLPDDERRSLLSALAFLSKQKAFIEFRFIALEQIEWESNVRELYSRLEKSTGNDDATINVCRNYLTEISTGCEDRLKKLDALDTESVTDTPETSRAVREFRERVEEIERVTIENRRHLQTREIAGTLGEIRQLEARESDIETDFQGAIPVQFITGNFEPLDTEVMFQKMRIESLKELSFPDATDENKKLS